MKKSFDAAIEAEKSQTRLDTAFKAVGATTKEHTAAMTEVAEVSRRAALDDEALMDSLAKLSRVTGDAAKAQDLLGTAADIARGRGIELEAATQIVTKANLGQLGALKRIGIEIPKVTAAQDALKAAHEKATAEQIKAAKAADETATRQSAIAALQKQYAGASEEYGKTAAGAQDRFRVAVENLQESLGQKLLPVFADVAEWVTSHMPQIEAVVTGVTGAIGIAFQRLAAIAEVAWPRIQAAAEAVADWYENHLEPTITSVSRSIAKAWDKSGADSKESTARNFGSIPPILKAQMQNGIAIMNATLAVLRGDWSTAWNEIKQIPVRTFMSIVDTIRTLAGTLLSVAKQAGKAVVDGITSGLSSLKSAVTAKLVDIRDAVAGVAGAAYAAAYAVGRQIVQGIAAGLDSLRGWLWDKAKELAAGAVKAAADAIIPGSPSKLSAMMVGVPIAQGIAKGMGDEASRVNSKAAEVARKAVEAAANAVREGRSKFADAWAGYSSAALAAFDDIASQVKTKSEKALEAMRAARAQADIQSAVTEARAGLTAAQASGDQEQIVAAQKTLDDALYRQKEYGLEQRAALERAKLDEQTALNRVRFEEWLETRNAQQQKEIATEDKGQKAIIKKIQSYNPAYHQRGVELGMNLAAGLLDARGAVVDAANQLAAAIAAALNVPWQPAVAAAVEGMQAHGMAQGGIVQRPTLAMIGEAGPEAVVPLDRLQGGGTSIVINFPNYVGDRAELTDALRRGLWEIARRNPGSLPGVA